MLQKVLTAKHAFLLHVDPRLLLTSVTHTNQLWLISIVISDKKRYGKFYPYPLWSVSFAHFF